ncbi:hypothetical protein NP493_314g02026 [Ridgeia piscesae]|uniref:Uncharacterized protein n=1 Tax=Ridgeia piscesae TaxID=27915 RepID=A0AAD9L5V0_RIDPI|nr:hypothetical protein NP493_314g02026 [Ridgeia piscesae]
MYTVVSQLVSDIYTIPAALVTFFKTAQKNAVEQGVQCPHNCVGLKLIATGVRNRILEVAASTDDLSDRLQQFADCSYEILTSTNYGHCTHRTASHFIKTNRNWLLEQVETISDHFSNPVFELVDSHPLEDDVVDYTENYLLSLTSSILHSPSGESHLSRVYNYLHNNIDWAVSQLDITPLLGEGSSSPVTSLVISTSAREEDTSFNPLVEYKRIGHCNFDHRAIEGFTYDWNRLLCCDLGLTETGLRNLLSHREDVQNSSYLSETDQKHVNTLKAKFHLSP